MSNSSSTSAVAEFDTLRREATKLERHLEDRVARYQQLAQRLTTEESTYPYPASTSSSSSKTSNTGSSLLDSAETGTLNGGTPSTSPTLTEEESALSIDITRTISAMSDLVNSRMPPAAERTGRSQHAHFIKRYREILFDCSADFKKTSAAVARKREAMELFSKRNFKDEKGGDTNPDVEHLLRERNAIGSSVRSATSVLNQAEEIRGDLRQQGVALRGVTSKVQMIAGNVPGVNYLIDKIHRRRNREDWIVSGVVASCILFTLWYVFVA